MRIQRSAEEALTQVRAEATLDELERWGAKQMIAEALQGEVAEYLARHAQPKDEAGQALVVRNG